MKAILVLGLFWCIQNSGGIPYNFPHVDRFFDYEPRKPLVESKLFDPVCDQDELKYAAKCPGWAQEAGGGTCDQMPWVQEHCRKSCNMPCKPEPTTKAPGATAKPPAPKAFCRDRDRKCEYWKKKGKCENADAKLNMAIFCGVTCGTCKEPTPDACKDEIENCKKLKDEGWCTSNAPAREYEVKTNCLLTCGFCDDIVP